MAIFVQWGSAKIYMYTVYIARMMTPRPFKQGKKRIMYHYFYAKYID